MSQTVLPPAHETSQPAPDRVLARRAAICWTVVFVLGALTAMMFSGVFHRTNAAVAVGFVALILGLVAAALALQFGHDARQSARLMGGRGLLAVWTCSPEEWARFIPKPRWKSDRTPQTAWVGQQGFCFRGRFHRWTTTRIEKFIVRAGVRPAVIDVSIAPHGFTAILYFIYLISSFFSSHGGAARGLHSTMCRIPVPAAFLHEATAVAAALGVEPLVV